MRFKKKVLIIVIAILAIIGTIFAVLMGIYYYMIHTLQQKLRETMSKHDGPNPKLPSQNVSNVSKIFFKFPFHFSPHLFKSFKGTI